MLLSSFIHGLNFDIHFWYHWKITQIVFVYKLIQFILYEEPTIMITMTIFPFDTMHTLFSIVLNILLTSKSFLENEIRCHCTQSMTINQSTFPLFSRKRMATSILGLMFYGHQILQKRELMFAQTKQYMIRMWGIQYNYSFLQLY